MQSSKQGVWKEYHLSIDGIQKGYKGLDLGAESLLISINFVEYPWGQIILLIYQASVL